MRSERSDQQGVTTLAGLHLVEYQVIKEEQKARIGFRDNLLYVALAAVTAVVAAAAQSEAPVLLLSLPPVCVVLGWTYLVNDEKISAIGTYIREELGPQLAALSQSGDRQVVVFGWEMAHRSDDRRKSRKLIQLLIDLAAFCLVPLAGLVAFWTTGEYDAGLLSVSVIEGLAITGLGVQMLLYARPSSWSPAAPSGR
ncbi:hypothetical protein [Streptomyces sp. NPDC060184]|uniref:hypothetical protein n=1 Tax=Streptomyces sp. NPDC060184 TaxID=3347064 RepID=UPI00365DC7B5